VTRRAVPDASALVALLVDGGQDGRWATRALAGVELLAPHLLPVEVANVLRRLELQGAVTADQSAQAHGDLLDLDVDLWPYDVVADRAWELRRNLSTYDAVYVAVAELAGARLITLDRRIERAPRLRCEVVSP
jgi:predicted nucleic acid-binding protein